MKAKKTNPGKKQTNRISKEMTFHEILEKFPESGKVFIEHNMFCALGCPMAAEETLEQGCMAHGVEVDEILQELEKVIKIKKEK